VPESEVSLCECLVEQKVSCSLTKLTSTGGPVSETLGVEGSCVQSNRSNVMQFVNNTKMFVKMFDLTVRVYKLEIKL
jgi:hypothetical protein